MESESVGANFDCLAFSPKTNSESGKKNQAEIETKFLTQERSKGNSQNDGERRS